MQNFAYSTHSTTGLPSGSLKPLQLANSPGSQQRRSVVGNGRSFHGGRGVAAQQPVMMGVWGSSVSIQASPSSHQLQQNRGSCASGSHSAEDAGASHVMQTYKAVKRMTLQPRPAAVKTTPGTNFCKPHVAVKATKQEHAALATADAVEAPSSQRSSALADIASTDKNVKKGVDVEGRIIVDEQPAKEPACGQSLPPASPSMKRSISPSKKRPTGITPAKPLPVWGARTPPKKVDPRTLVRPVNSFGSEELTTDDMQGELPEIDATKEAKIRGSVYAVDKASVRSRDAAYSGWLQYRGHDADSRIFMICGSYAGKALREEFETRGYVENDCGMDDTKHSGTFDFLWTLKHDDIPYTTLAHHQVCVPVLLALPLRPVEMLTFVKVVNHFQQSACQLGAKVGLLRNLRSLRWFDAIECDEFYPRAYNLQNPWEVANFIEDYIYNQAQNVLLQSSKSGRGEDTAHHSELMCAVEMTEKHFNSKDAAWGGLTLVDLRALQSATAQSKNKEEAGGCGDGVIGKRTISWDQSWDRRLADVLERITKTKHQAGMDGIAGAWIVKPSHGSRGRGIRCYATLEDILRYGFNRKHGAFAQKYIERPLLIDQKKFDIRLWVLVTDWNPLTIWIFSDCYLRFTTEDFSLDNLGEAFAHLCNRCVQSKNDDYDSSDGGSMWNVEDFKEYLGEEHGNANLWEEKLLPQIEKIVVRCMHCVQDVMDARSNSFEWYGLDLMIDEMLKVWLIEVNISPDMSRLTPVMDTLVPAATNDLLNLVLPHGDSAPEPPGDLHWRLIFRGKKVNQEVLQKRFWKRKTLDSQQRVGKPFSIREALVQKLGNDGTTLWAACSS